MYKSVNINVMKSSSELHANKNYKQDVGNAISKLLNFCQLAYKALDEVKALNEDLEIEYVSAMSEVEHLEDCYHFKFNSKAVSNLVSDREWADNIFQSSTDNGGHIAITEGPEGVNTNISQIKSEPLDKLPLQNDLRIEIKEHHGDNKDKAMDKAEMEICLEPESKKQRLIKNEYDLNTALKNKEEIKVILKGNTNTRLGKIKVFQTPGPKFKKIICQPKQLNANPVLQSSTKFPIQTFSLPSPNQKKIIPIPTATKMQSVKIPFKILTIPSLMYAAVAQQKQNKNANLLSQVKITQLGTTMSQSTLIPKDSTGAQAEFISGNSALADNPASATNTIANNVFEHEVYTPALPEDENVNVPQSTLIPKDATVVQAEFSIGNGALGDKPASATQAQPDDEKVNEKKPIDDKFLVIHDEQMGKIIQCKICTCRFSRMDIFKRHLGTFHREHPDIECDICFEIFETGAMLNFHMDSHQKEYPFKCNTCGKRFEVESKLKYHVTTPNKCILPALKCKICKETFLTITEITRHFSNRHEGSNCDVCCLPATENCKEEKHFVEYLKPYKCQVCDEEFSFKKEFYKHQKTAHKKEARKRQKIVNGAQKVRRQCQFCTCTFKCDADLHEHERVHTGEKPYECPYCGRKFARKERLKVHKRLHTGERPFQCDLCGKEMIEKRNIKRHSCIMRKSL